MLVMVARNEVQGKDVYEPRLNKREETNERKRSDTARYQRASALACVHFH